VGPSRIAGGQEACPVFPHINEHSGTGEALCCVQACIAGLVAAAGQSPTKAEMGKIALGVINDPSMRDIILKVQADVRPFGGFCPPARAL